MFRRVVSLLLLPCVLLTQSAAVFGHAHGPANPFGHDLRPHFHSQVVPTGHDHTHGPGGHHHHHDEDALEPEPSTSPEHQAPADHDTDAVYVAGGEAVVGGRFVVVHDHEWLVIWVSVADGYSGLWLNPLHQFSDRWHPPPCGSSCPLYVRHLTLLI
jgi:hypothetical protein